MSKDYRIEVRVKNGLLYKKITDAGFDSIREFCNSAGIQYTQVIGLINLRYKAVCDSGNLSKVAAALCDYFCCLPEDLFSASQMFNALPTNVSSAYVDRASVEALMMPSAAEDPAEILECQRDASSVLAKLFETAGLTPRERKVLELRHLSKCGDGMVLEEVGKQFDLTRERIRGIESNAMEKIRSAAIKCGDIGVEHFIGVKP